MLDSRAYVSCTLETEINALPNITLNFSLVYDLSHHFLAKKVFLYASKTSEIRITFHFGPLCVYIVIREECIS